MPPIRDGHRARRARRLLRQPRHRRQGEVIPDQLHVHWPRELHAKPGTQHFPRRVDHLGNERHQGLIPVVLHAHDDVAVQVVHHDGSGNAPRAVPGELSELGAFRGGRAGRLAGQDEP